MNNIDWLSFLKGASGKLSAIRIGFMMALLAVLINWSWINFHKQTELVPIPDNAVALVACLAGAKVVQRFGESKNDTTKKEETKQ